MPTNYPRSAPRKSYGTLIADSDQTNPKLPAQQLERAGHAIKLVTDGEQALDAFDQAEADFDVVSQSRANLRHTSTSLMPVPEKIQECVFERSGYKVRLVDSHGQRSKASMLIERMYAWRGYHTDTVATFSHNPNQIMLEASSGQHLFGTLTLGLDSEEGLLADALYEEKINVFRRAGRKVCELSKLAVEAHCGSKEVLASLFHLAYIYARIIHKACDVFIEVNPRHAGFYQQRLGFRQIGEMRTCPRVNAPALLLHLELAYMDAQISRHSSSRNNKEKSLYPYFFSTCRICARIKRRCLTPTGGHSSAGVACPSAASPTT